MSHAFSKIVRDSRAISSTEMLFVAFAMPVTNGFVIPLPISLTKIFFVLSIGAYAFRVIRGKFGGKLDLEPFLAFIPLLALVLVSSIGMKLDYSADKLKVFIAYTSWSYMGAVLIVNTPLRFQRFLTAFVVIATFCAIYAVLGFVFGFEAFRDADYQGSRATVGLGNPIPMGQAAGAAILILAWNSLRHSSRASLVLFLIVGAPLGIAMIAGASRTPIIAAVLGMILLFGKSLGSQAFGRRAFAVGIAAVLVCGITAFALRENKVIESSADRIAEFAQNGFDTRTALLRQKGWQTATRMFLAEPAKGHGFGSYAKFVSQRHSRRDLRGHLTNKEYPHNIVLELLSEMGLLGLLSFFVLLLPLRHLVVLGTQKTFATDFGLAALLSMFFLVNAMASGDLNDNRVLFMFLGLSASIWTKSRRASRGAGQQVN